MNELDVMGRLFYDRLHLLLEGAKRICGLTLQEDGLIFPLHSEVHRHLAPE